MDYQGLLRALSDPHRAVRIATLRALMRLPLDSDTAAALRPHRHEYERRDLSWATWVPDDQTVSEITALVDCPEPEERSSARQLASMAKSEITREFAGLALKQYDPGSENLLADATRIAQSAFETGSEFRPDVTGLFGAYLVFLRRAAAFWFGWVRQLAGMFDPARETPSWFPLSEGALAACRQIEWAVSRAAASDILTALDATFKSGTSRERFAAAQLVEWAERARRQVKPSEFGGGSGPADVLIDYDATRLLEYKSIQGGQLPTASALSPASPVPPAAQVEELQSAERKINFWIQGADGKDVKLERGKPSTGNFRVGKQVVGNLIKGPGGTVPDSDVPAEGLPTTWTVVPTEVRLETLDSTVNVSSGGLATFNLLIPRAGDSKTISFRLTPLSEHASLLVLIYAGGRLYRELTVSLEVTAEIVADVPLTRAADADLRTTHEWTTPPGQLIIHVSKAGKAVIYGTTGANTLPPGQEVDIETAPAQLSGPVNTLRAALESFRVKWSDYLNDIDPNEVLLSLQNFQPQYEWSQLSYSADAAHEAAWKKVAASQELRDVAFYGRNLYNTLFPSGSDLRNILEQLPPGQLIHIVWRPDSEAGWIPQLPWALLYTEDLDMDAPVDGARFWAHRFRIQHTAYKVAGAQPAALGRPTGAYCANALFFGDSKKEPATGEARWQRDYWAGLGPHSLNLVVPAAGVTAAKPEVLRALTQPGSATLTPPGPVAVLYFFCHYGDANGNLILRFGLTGDPEDIVRMPELGTAVLASRPLVFANACATAGSGVYSANAITKTFFDRGCRAFIGTDCMVPAVMASRLAVIFFQFLLRMADKQGKPMAAGEALVQARLFLWCHYRNIGGLLYSYLNNYDLYMADETEIRALSRGAYA